MFSLVRFVFVHGLQAILGNAPTIDHLQLLSSVHSLNLVGELSSRSGHLQAWVGVMCPSWPRGMHSVSRVVHFEQLAHFRDERQLRCPSWVDDKPAARGCAIQNWALLTIDLLVELV